MQRLALVLCAILLQGCATIDNFEEKYDADVSFKVGMGYQIDSQTDQLLQTTYKDQCDKNAKAIFGPGVEWKEKHELELLHESWYLCGTPFNNHPEMYSLDLRYMYKIGGE